MRILLISTSIYTCHAKQDVRTRKDTIKGHWRIKESHELSMMKTIIIIRPGEHSVNKGYVCKSHVNYCVGGNCSTAILIRITVIPYTAYIHSINVPSDLTIVRMSLVTWYYVLRHTYAVFLESSPFILYSSVVTIIISHKG